MDGVGGRAKGDVGAHEGPFADIDLAVIDESQVEIGIDAVAKMDVAAAPVAMEGRLDVAALP